MGWLISLTPPRFLSRRRRESQKSCFWEGVPKKRDMSRVSALRAAILKVVDESDGEEVYVKSETVKMVVIESDEVCLLMTS